MSFPGLPSGLHGMRIAQLSDLRVGPHTSRRHLARIAKAVRSARPDLIVLTGDQVDDYARDVEPLGRALGELCAPLGVIAVAGNHDVYAGWAAVRRGMERLGWRVLVNGAVALDRIGALPAVTVVTLHRSPVVPTWEGAERAGTAATEQGRAARCGTQSGGSAGGLRSRPRFAIRAGGK